MARAPTTAEAQAQIAPVEAVIRERLGDLMDPSRFIGRSAEQVDEFLDAEVGPRLRGVDLGGAGDELRV